MRRRRSPSWLPHLGGQTLSRVTTSLAGLDLDTAEGGSLRIETAYALLGPGRTRLRSAAGDAERIQALLELEVGGEVEAMYLRRGSLELRWASGIRLRAETGTRGATWDYRAPDKAMSGAIDGRLTTWRPDPDAQPPSLAGQTLVRAEQVFHHLELRTAEDWRVTVENEYALDRPDGDELRTEAGQEAELVALLQTLLPAAITDADTSGGGLALTLADGHRLRVAADSAYEAWHYGGPHGELIVSTPGGELAIWGPAPEPG